MGFYSFYRIFKDIFKTFFGKRGFKIFLVILLFVFAFTFYSSKVNASDLRPWNVYNNTTEFNWSRIVNLNYIDNRNIDYNYYKVSADNVYYLYNPDNNTGTLHLYTYLSTDGSKIMAFYDLRNYQTMTVNEAEYYFDEGYIDVPINTLFTPMADFYIALPSSSSYELYLFDDKYSNIETYNELSALAVDLHNFLYGDEPSNINPSVISGLVGSYSGTFTNTTGFSTLYFPVKSGYKYDLSFVYTSQPGAIPSDSFRFGFTSSQPSPGVAYSSLNKWDTINYSRSYSFTADEDTYFYISYTSLFSNFKFSSNYNPAQSGGINQQIINQGEETRETLTDSSISQNSSDYTLPSDSTNDVTQDGFSSIFDRIRTTFTTGSSTPAVINVPFTNKSFTISKSSVFGSANLGIVQTIIEAFWWFIVSLFIVKDIFKKIEKIKTGNIEFTETTNIKEDIL